MDAWAQYVPLSSVERLERQRTSHVAGSLLSAPAAAALAAVDLEPVGEVMGCIVMHLGWRGFGCGQYGSGGRFGTLGNSRDQQTPVITSGTFGSSWQGFGPYVQARYHAYDTALTRMLAEAGTLGADGVVGVGITWTQLDTGARELVALGTAVRHRSALRRRPESAWPYCTQLSGEDVASALAGGWAPLGIAIGLAVAIKHDDWAMQWQMARSLGAGRGWNVEVDGLTALMTAARAEARQKLAARAKVFHGAEHVVLSSNQLSVHEQVCATDQRDHIAEAMVVGTALARDRAHQSRERRPTLSILPLHR